MGSDDKTLKQMLEHFESALRQGLISQVAKALSELDWNQVPRPWRQPLANVCRRAGLVSFGLKILSPIARPQTLNEDPATPVEMAEYAVLLQRIGVVDEALSILERLSVKDVPDAALFKAYCHFQLWNSEEAIACLEEYLQTPVNGYARTLGQLHLAAAYLTADRRLQARELLIPLVHECRWQNHTRLLASSLELSAQLCFQARDLTGAQASLNEAVAVLRRANDQTFASKWRAAIASRLSNSTAPLKVFREEALRRHDPESVREADLLALQVEFKAGEFDHLYFGSPYEQYRARVRLALGQSPRGSEYIWGDVNSTALFDLSSGEISGYPSLSQGSKVHQLAHILLRDFYRPSSVGSLFSELFTGETFDVEHSPDRVHQVLSRARRFLEAAKLPLQITSRSGKFNLQLSGPLAIRIRLERQLPDVNSVQLHALRSQFSEEPFSAREARTALSLSPAEFKRLASWAVEHGQLQKLGASSSTVYTLVRRRTA
jgi:tetratricopeptide (TPR) repeat protein